MDLQKDLLLALAGKTEEELNTAIDQADTVARTIIQEVKPEWPVVAVIDDAEVKLPQEYPEPIKAAIVLMAAQILAGEKPTPPETLTQDIADTKVCSIV